MPITLPSVVRIPMTQGGQAGCRPVVRSGDRVCVGQLIGDSKSAMAAPVHSSVSGTVISIERGPSQQEQNDIHVVIETDGRQTVADTVQPPVINSRADFLQAVRSCGLVGLGGAGFPTERKYAASKKTPLHTLIVNGAECEPFVTSDHTNMTVYVRDIIAGSAAIMKWLAIEKCIIAIGADKKETAELYRSVTAELSGISVALLPRQFPAGEETMVIREAAHVRILPGNLPADQGFLVSNSTTVLKLQHYLMTGMPLVSRTVTVDGDAVKMPMNVEVPVGTSIADVLAFCAGEKKPLRKLIAGGPMTGTALPSAELSVIKTNNALLFFSENRSDLNKETACINCGRCMENCPAGLVPTMLYKQWLQKDLKSLEKNHILACIGCGCCSYGCPARKPLSDALTMAKETVAAGKPMENDR